MRYARALHILPITFPQRWSRPAWRRANDVAHAIDRRVL